MCPIDDEDSPILNPATLSFRDRVRTGRVVPIISEDARQRHETGSDASGSSESSLVEKVR